MVERLIRNPKIIELLFPDDFILTAAPEIVFNPYPTEFTVGHLIEENLHCLLNAQLAQQRDKSRRPRELGLVAIIHRGRHYTTDVFKGQESYITYQIGYGEFSREVYLAKSVIEYPPTPIVDATTDFYHNHLPIKGEDPKLTDLFSTDDVINMGYRRAERYWLMGHDGTVLCLMNSSRIDFTDRPLPSFSDLGPPWDKVNL